MTEIPTGDNNHSPDYNLAGDNNHSCDKTAEQAEALSGVFRKGKRFPFGGALMAICGGVGFCLYSSGLAQLMIAEWQCEDTRNSPVAIEYLDLAIAANPKLDIAYERRALCILEADSPDYAAARKDIAEAMRLAPTNTSYLETSVQVEREAENIQNEIAALTSLIEKDPQRANENMALRAERYEVVGEVSKAEADRKAIIKNYSDLIEQGEDFRIQRAEQYRHLGQMDKAIRDCEMRVSLKEKPEASDFFHLAYLYEHSGRDAEAIGAYSMAMGVFGGEYVVDKARQRRAVLYLKLHENAKALADAQALLNYLNTDPRRSFHAHVLDLMGLKTKAVKERNEAVAELSKNAKCCGYDKEYEAQLYARRADFYTAGGELKKAMRACATAISLHASTSWPYPEIGSAYIKLGDYDSAIKCFSKAIALNGSESGDRYEQKLVLANAYTGLAEAYVLKQNPKLAIEYANKTLRLSATQNYAAATYWRAKAYRMLGKNNLAKVDENILLGLEFDVSPVEEIR